MNKKKIVFDRVQELVDSHNGIYIGQRLMKICIELGEKDFLPMPPDAEDADNVEIDGHSILERVAFRDWKSSKLRNEWNSLTIEQRKQYMKDGKNYTNFKDLSHITDLTIDSDEWKKEKEPFIEETIKDWGELYQWETEEAEQCIEEYCAPGFWFGYRDSDGSAVITTFQCDLCDQFDPKAEETENYTYICQKCMTKQQKEEGES